MCNVTTISNHTVEDVRTLLDASRMNQTVFAEKDQQAIGQYWNKVFRHAYKDAVSKRLYEAIARRTGAKCDKLTPDDEVSRDHMCQR